MNYQKNVITKINQRWVDMCIRRTTNSSKLLLTSEYQIYQDYRDNNIMSR